MSIKLLVIEDGAYIRATIILMCVEECEIQVLCK